MGTTPKSKAKPTIQSIVVALGLGFYILNYNFFLSYICYTYSFLSRIFQYKFVLIILLLTDMPLPSGILLCKNNKMDKQLKAGSHQQKQMSQNEGQKQEDSHHECCSKF